MKETWASKTGADGLTFGERLKDLIERRKTTAAEVAKTTGIPASALSDYQKDPHDCKNGRVRVPDTSTFKKLAEYFEVTYEYLYGDVSASARENLAASEYYGFTDKTAELLKNMHPHGTEIKTNTDRLCSDMLALFNELFQNGFADLLLDMALLNADLSKLQKDSHEKEVLSLVASSRKGPAGTALITPLDFERLSMVRIEQDFGNIAKQSMATMLKRKCQEK